MTDDIKDLLTLAVPDRALLHASGDAVADLARGRRARRRRHLGLVACTAVALGAVAGGLAASAQPGHTPAASRSPASAQASPRARRASGHPIALVAYGGAQVPGYEVTEVPAGWTIQGGNAFVLTLAPSGDPDTDFNSFEGKLVIMLESASEVPGQPGTAETVDGQPGVFWTQQGGTEALAYRYTPSTWVYIQAPDSLGWDAAQLVAFAQGVTVLGTAQQSNG